MSPFVKSLPSYIKDTNHALKTFRDFNFPGQSKLIFTMDITSLYTVIPNHVMCHVRAYDVGLVLSSPTRTKSPDLSELLPSLIISRAFPSITSTVLPVPYAKNYTSAKRAADWVIVSGNTLGMLRFTIKTLLNQSRDI